MPAPKPEDLSALGRRLDEAQRKREAASPQTPSQTGIAFRFTTELVAALVVGGGMGWGLDWIIGRWSPFHTKPFFLVVFFVLGAAAGIRNVMRAAGEINAGMAAGSAPPADKAEREK